MSTPTVTHWPACPTCGHLLSVTVGCPVVISPAGHSLVSVDVDLSEANDWDSSSTVSCACDDAPEFDQDTLDTLGRCVTEAMVAASMSAEAIVNRADKPL